MLATKVHGRTWPGENGRGLGRKHVLASIDLSLQRLGLDYVDLYQIHRWDSDTPIEETMEALHDVVRAGKARYIGASSMYAWQFAKAQAVAERNGWTRFVSMQNHYNLIYREEEREMIPQCIDQGVGLLPWSPLARGILAGNRGARRASAGRRARRPTRSRTRSTCRSSTRRSSSGCTRSPRRGASRARRSRSRGCCGKPGVTAPIVGATKLAHVEDALAAEELELSEDEVAALEEPYVPHAVSGHE